MKELPLASLIPLWRILHDEGVTALITPSLDYVGALELGPLDVRFAGGGPLQTIGEGLRSLVASLDDETTLHFLHRVDEGSGADISAFGAEAAGLVHPALLRYRAARADWLSGRVHRRARVFLFFSLGSSVRSALARGEIGMPMLFGNVAGRSAEPHQKALKALATLRDRLASRLSSVSIPSRQLSPQEVRQLHFELLNPNRAKERAQAPTSAVLDNLWSDEFIKRHGAEAAEYSEAECLVAEDIEDGRGAFRQGALRRRVCTLKMLPEGGTDYVAAEPLLALGSLNSDRSTLNGPFPYWLAVTVRVQPQGRSKWLLNTQHGLVEALRGALPFLSDSSALKDAADAAKRGSIQSLFQELTELSSKLVTLSVSLLLEAKTVEDLDLMTEASRAAFARAGNSQLLLEDVAQLPAFLSLLPGAGPYQVRKKACTSRNAADFLPVFAPWRGTAKARSLFASPSGELVRLDLFDKSLSPVHHLLGVADSGSGKSMGAGALLIDALATGTEGILIDNGNSWKELTELFGGTHIPVEQKTSISPFAPYKEILDPTSHDGTLDNEALAQAVRFIEVCAADLTFRGFDKPTADFVGRSVRRAYERRFRKTPNERPLISAFRDEMLALGRESAGPEGKTH